MEIPQATCFLHEVPRSNLSTNQPSGQPVNQVSVTWARCCIIESVNPVGELHTSHYAHCADCTEQPDISRCRAPEALAARNTPECFSHHAQRTHVRFFCFCRMQKWLPVSCKNDPSCRTHSRLRKYSGGLIAQEWFCRGQCLLCIQVTLVFSA